MCYCTMLMGKDAADEKREYDIKWTANAMYIGPPSALSPSQPVLTLGRVRFSQHRHSEPFFSPAVPRMRHPR